MIRTVRFFAAALFALALTLFATGQGITTGTIKGTVVDVSGAVVQNAQVTATNNAQGTQLNATSGAEGLFSIYAVPIGVYTIDIAASGFSTVHVTSVQINSGATTDLKSVRLQVGATAQVVVNGSSEALLQTSDSQVTTTFSSQTVQNLPLNNGFDTAAELIPGVVSTHAANFSNSNGDNFSVNGQRGRANNFEIDGQSNNDNYIAGPQAFFDNQDAIQELQVITNDFSAQYGRNAGSVVNYVTKSGTNAFHGSGFEFYNGSFLQSLAQESKSPLAGFCSPGVVPTQQNNCTPIAVPRVTENRYGGTLGGPILKDKLFFFGSTYWDPFTTGTAPANTGTFTIPTPAGIQALESVFPGNPAVGILSNFGPYSIKTGNPGPVGTPQNQNVTGPNGMTVSIPFAPVQRTVASPSTDQEDLGRLDWQPTGKDRLFVRYFYQSTLASAAFGNIPTGNWVDVPGTTHSIGADWTHDFNEHWVDQLRYSYQESKLAFQGGSYPDCLTTNVASCPAFLNFQSGEFSDFGESSSFPQGRIIKVTQIQNNATWTHGNHTLLFGGEFDYQNSPLTWLPFYGPELSYVDFNSFIQDNNGISILADGSLTVPLTENDAAAYVQDDWKLTPSFTAHIGLRWEFYQQAINELHDSQVTRETNPATAFWDQSLPLAFRTVPSVPQFYKNFQPRLGFAWNPEFNRNMVVSGGYAINTDPQFTNPFQNSFQLAPSANAGTVNCPCQPASGSFTTPAVRAVVLPSLPRGGNPRFRDYDYVSPNFRYPYTQTYTLGVQYQLGSSIVGSLRYVGSHSIDNFQSIDANPYLLPVAQAFPNTVSPSSLCQGDPTMIPGVGRPDCNFSNEALVNNGAWLIYNGLQANLTTRSFHRVTTTISYTFSRALDNASEIYPTGTGGNTAAYSQNPLDTNLGERGVSGNSYPNALGLSYVYEFPTFAKGNGFLPKIMNGYQLNGIYRYNSGQPFQPYQPLSLANQFGPDSSFCDLTFQNSAVGFGNDVCRLVLSNKKAPLNTIAYLNPYGGPNSNTPVYIDYNSDFVDSNGVYHSGTPVDPKSSHWIINNQAYALSVGNPYPGSGRNILRAQPFNNLDASIYKNTKLSERVSMQLQFTAYNALNHAFRSSQGDGSADGSFTSFVGAYNTQFTGQPQPFLSQAYGVSNIRFILLGGKIIF
jgi:hypothetical protein